ncbi:RsmD family RNA methyltransferase [Parabacteroides sp. FAFU027]|uniref:RsmD family RNA methyltransferase n=1 Tax=Parabacteroides sp. FAFU027 TaxID=2922715 RepID=UPI001FB0230C|nr:RsmD family RNA methyltransferase [Parabacteroides sp. FAFU027]
MRIIGGEFKRRRFDVPKNITARPTTDFARENLFNVLENRLDLEDITALDLFAGTGAVSFELISRGCGKVVSIEKASTQFSFIIKVMKELKTDRLIPVRGDVFKYIGQTREKFDFIFADPPYDLKGLETIPGLIFENDLLKEGGIFILEHGRNNDFSEMPQFVEKRVYGSVNFSFFENKE